MDAMDEFQEADVLWPDAEDDELVPYATTDMVVEEPAASVSSIASVLRRRFEGSFLPGAAGPSSSAGASPDADDDEEEWLEADVLWPDTLDIVPRSGGRGFGGGSLWPLPGGSGRAGGQVSPADRWRPAASSPIDIPAKVAARRRRFGAAMSRRL